jgi:hypothetical protein
VHQLYRDRPEEHAQALVEALREKHPDLSTVKLYDAVRRTVYWQFYQTSLAVTQRLAADVGAPLLDLVFNGIEEQDPVPAIRLISSAIRLDRTGRFPEERIRDLAVEFANNPLALRVLSGLVVAHFHLFDVPRDVRERVCGLLDIDLRPQLATSRRRLIARNST